MEKVDNDVGLEIECCFPRNERDAIANAVSSSWPPGLFVSLQMGSDCSVYGRPAVDGTAEIRARFKESKRAEAIAWITDLLKEHNAYTNMSCGLHVHIDCRHRDYMLVQDKLATALPYMKKFVKKSRHDNHYCVMGAGTGHYHAVNYGAYYAHQTVEVRLHHGSVDGEEISTWIDFLLYVVNSPKATRLPKTLFGAKKVWRWQEGMIRRMRRKEAKAQEPEALRAEAPVNIPVPPEGTPMSEPPDSYESSEPEPSSW